MVHWAGTMGCWLKTNVLRQNIPGSERKDSRFRRVLSSGSGREDALQTLRHFVCLKRQESGRENGPNVRICIFLQSCIMVTHAVPRNWVQYTKSPAGAQLCYQAQLNIGAKRTGRLSLMQDCQDDFDREQCATVSRPCAQATASINL